ncbi:hypothetical protein ONZ45_g5117 [Pleurotus djamor]|nr:hypothetical protein ONZ45_g5117 [Pleurotus djamor]
MSSIALTSSMAAIQIGILVSSFLFGVVTLQAFLYYRNYPKDAIYIKIFSAVVWILELFGMIFSGHLVYSSAIGPARTAPVLMFIDPPYQILATILITNWSGCVVQFYFIDRVRRFTKLLWPAVICAILVLYTFAGVILLVVIGKTKGLLEYTIHWRWLSISGLVISAAVDIFLAAMLCWNLASQRKSLFKRSTNLIDRIISMTIATGLLTSIVAVATAILNLALPFHLIYMGVYICLARIYANSYFASLNARHTLRSGGDDNVIDSFRFASRSDQSGSSGNTAQGPHTDKATYLGRFKIDLNSPSPGAP